MKQVATKLLCDHFSVRWGKSVCTAIVACVIVWSWLLGTHHMEPHQTGVTLYPLHQSSSQASSSWRQMLHTAGFTLLSSSPVDGRSNVSGTHVNLAVHHVVVMDECLQRVIIISRLQLFAKSLKLFYLLPFRAFNKGTGERMEPSLV